MMGKSANRPDGGGARCQAAKSTPAVKPECAPAAPQPWIHSVDLCPRATLVHACGRCVLANPAAAKLFGASLAQELVGRDVLELIHRDHRESVNQWIEQVYGGGVTPTQGAALVRLDGCRIEVELAGARVQFDGKPAIQMILWDLTERKRADEVLLETEQGFRTFIRRSPDGIILIDGQGRVIEWNDGEEQITGIPRSQALGRPLWEIQCQLAPQEKRTHDFVETARKKILSGFEEGAALKRTLEDEIVRPDGSRHTVQSTVFAVGDGETILAAGISRDITARKRIEEALRESEERFQAYMNNSPAVAWMKDEQDRYVYLSGSYENRVGVRLEEWRGKTDFELWPREIAEEFRRNDREVLRTGRAIEVVEETPAPDGGRFHWWNIKFPFRDASGKTYIGGIGVDITERKRMEGELRQLNESLERQVAQRTKELTHMVDRLQDEVVRRVLAEGRVRKHSQMLDGFFRYTITPLAFMDSRFTFVRVNHAYAGADGKDPEDFIGRNYFDLCPDKESRAIFERVVRTGQPYGAYAGSLPCFGGSPRDGRYWNWQLTPLLSETGDVQFLVFSLEDVTEQQKALQQAQERARQLHKLTLELSQAEDHERKRIADILHDDIQQVLAAAKFHLGLIDNGKGNADALQQIVVEVREMLKDAIDKSRSLSHELSPALYQVNLGEMLTWLAGHMQQGHGLTVYVETCGQVDARSEPLRVFLFKAAQELLFNVVKHARANEARIRVRRMGRYLCLSVADRGRGFDPQRLQEATGFGLGTIRERVELLGGRMKVRSRHDAGSRFLIVVPDEDPATIATQAEYSADSDTV
jgi:PAS domain S-box-containing protein